MLGVPLYEGIIAHDLINVKNSVLRVARPIITMTTEPVDSPIGIGGSKFGGLPDLPENVAWPTCEPGPLGFLGQVALAELQYTQAASTLPKDGLLSIFAYQDFNTGYQPGVYPDIPGAMSILYTPGAAALKSRTPPDGLNHEANGVLPTCRLALCESYDLPATKDIVPAALARDLAHFDEGDRSWNLHEVRGKCHSFGHHLMGYSVHFRTDDPSPGPEWTPLLCLGSDDNLGWSWCDGEHLAVYVHQEDLKNNTFRRIFGYAS
jgi:uncharacterized protein YwqG